MNFGTKLIVSMITISATIVGSIWAGFETLDGRMDKKVQEGEGRVVFYIDTLKKARDSENAARDKRIDDGFAKVSHDMSELREDIRGLYRIGQRIDRKVTIVQEPTDLYTKGGKKDSSVEGSL